MLAGLSLSTLSRLVAATIQHKAESVVQEVVGLHLCSRRHPQ